MKVLYLVTNYLSKVHKKAQYQFKQFFKKVPCHLPFTTQERHSQTHRAACR